MVCVGYLTTKKAENTKKAIKNTSKIANTINSKIDFRMLILISLN
jgi:hypothetical protein